MCIRQRVHLKTNIRLLLLVVIVRVRVSVKVRVGFIMLIELGENIGKS